MNCNLNKFSNYGVSQIVENRREGSVLVQLSDPPASCPDRAFSTHKGKLVVNPDAQPSLGWSQRENRPVITVPNRAMIQQVEATEVRQPQRTTYVNETQPSTGHGFFFWFFIALMFAAFCAGMISFINYLRREREEEKAREREAVRNRYERWEREQNRMIQDEREVAPRKRRRRGGKQRRIAESPRPMIAQRPSRPAPPSQPAAVHRHHSHSSNDGLLTGMLMGNMMSGNRHDRIIEREVERAPRYEPPSPPSRSSSFSSDDDDDRSSSSSSSWTDIFSSDSGGSDFSSDSGGGFFSSDSGSSSFSSDSDSSFGSD